MDAISLIISAILGGGLVSGIVALKKDKRDAKMTDLDFTKQIRDIAQEEVSITRVEMDSLRKETKKEIEILKNRVYDLEQQLKSKDILINTLILYIKQLRDILTTNRHPLPPIPEDIKPYV